MSVFKESGPVSFSEIREFLGEEEPGQPLSMSSLYNVPGSLLNNKGIVGVNIPISRSLPISLSNFYGMSSKAYQLGTFAFTDTGPFSFELNWKSVADVLVVAGGGSGGGKVSSISENLQVPGGGGAGGLVLLSKIELPIRTYTGTVGDGGKIAFNVKDAPASNGENSTLAISDAETVTALGGGYGGGMQGTNGGSGGSGGGQGVWAIPTFDSGNTASGTTDMGNNGGFGVWDLTNSNSADPEDMSWALGMFPLMRVIRSGSGGGAGTAGMPQLIGLAAPKLTIDPTVLLTGASNFVRVRGFFRGQDTQQFVQFENFTASPIIDTIAPVKTIRFTMSCTFRFQHLEGAVLSSANNGGGNEITGDTTNLLAYSLNIKPLFQIRVIHLFDNNNFREVVSTVVTSLNDFIGGNPSPYTDPPYQGTVNISNTSKESNWVFADVFYPSGQANLNFSVNLARPAAFPGNEARLRIRAEFIGMRVFNFVSAADNAITFADDTINQTALWLELSSPPPLDPIRLFQYSEGFLVPGAGRYLGDTFGTDYGDQGWFASGGMGGVLNAARPQGEDSLDSILNRQSLNRGGGGLGSENFSGTYASTNGMPNTGGGGGDWRNGGSGIVLIKIVSHITGPILNPSITETSVFEEDSLQVKSVTYAFSPFLPSEFNQPGIVVRIFQGEDLRFESSAAGPPTLPRVGDVSNAGFTFTSHTDGGFGYNGWLVQLVNASGAFLSERTPFPSPFVVQGVTASDFTPFVTTGPTDITHFLNGAKGENLSRAIDEVSTFNNLPPFQPRASGDFNRIFPYAILQAQVGDTIRITATLTMVDFGQVLRNNTFRFHLKNETSYTVLGQESGLVPGGGVRTFTRSFDYTIPAGTANGSYALAISAALDSTISTADYHTLQIF